MKDFKRQVDELSKTKKNKACVDCGGINPRWASKKYGVFVCLDCAGEHRSLGTSLDVICSVHMDDWNEADYQPLFYGGNAKFKEYLKYNNIKGDINSIYKNNLVIQYSKDLMDLIEKETGYKLSCAEKTRQRVGETKFSYTDYVRSLNQESLYSKRNSSTSSFLSNMGQKITENAKLLKNKTVHYSTKLGGQVMYHTKNLLNKSNEVISSYKKEKSPEPNKNIQNMQQSKSYYSSADWN